MRMGASRLMGDIIAALDDERLGGIAKSAVRQQLEKLDVAPLLGQLLGAMIKERRHLPLMDGLINWASKTLEANEHLIRQMVEERAGAIMRWTGLDDRLARVGVLRVPGHQPEVEREQDEQPERRALPDLLLRAPNHRKP